jgi:hypothetical protein
MYTLLSRKVSYKADTVPLVAFVQKLIGIDMRRLESFYR